MLSNTVILSHARVTPLPRGSFGLWASASFAPPRDQDLPTPTTLGSLYSGYCTHDIGSPLYRWQWCADLDRVGALVGRADAALDGGAGAGDDPTIDVVEKVDEGEGEQCDLDGKPWLGIQISRLGGEKARVRRRGMKAYEGGGGND